MTANKFDLSASVEAMAEAIVTMKGAENARAVLNGELKECHRAKVKWSEIRDKLAKMLELRGLKDGTLRVTLSTNKWCFEEQVELETFTKSVMTARADKGMVKDLISGKAKTVKPKGKKADKGSKAKSETVVEHCGIGMAKAMTQQGFIRFFNHLVSNIEDISDRGIHISLFMDDDKLDIVRDSLVECGYMVKDGAEYKVAVIKESEDEAE